MEVGFDGAGLYFQTKAGSDGGPMGVDGGVGVGAAAWENRIGKPPGQSHVARPRARSPDESPIVVQASRLPQGVQAGSPHDKGHMRLPWENLGCAAGVLEIAGAVRYNGRPGSGCRYNVRASWTASFWVLWVLARKGPRMAKWHDALIVVGLLALVGCQRTSRSRWSNRSRPPNFGGPTLASPVLVSPEPPPSPKVEPAAKPVPSAAGDRDAGAGGAAAVARRGAAGMGAGGGAEPVEVDRDPPQRHADRRGGAVRREHRAKGWDELGYHFVIGNGTDTANGLVEVGSRWPKQKWGAHAQTPSEEFNNFGIGICLVGNFDQSRPTKEQMDSLSRLVAYLMKTYRIPADHVIGHGDTKPTECPGKQHEHRDRPQDEHADPRGRG